MKRLLQIGFEQVGVWRLRDDQLALELTRMAGQRNVLYAFVQAGVVLYVGKTTGTLENRMGGYLRPHVTQRTNVRNNLALLKLLNEDLGVDIYAWADSGTHRIGEFHLNYAAGLEDSIIRSLSPPWNGARSVPTAGNAQSDGTEEARPLDAVGDTEAESATTNQVRVMGEAGVMMSSPMFEVQLGKTYFHQGFFNVPVKASGLFPAHGAEISIYCGEARTLIRATVDRKANQSNQTPRIYGRGALANWFGLYKVLNDSITVRAVSANEIELL